MRRLKQSGVYYLFAKRNGKQFSRSLDTTDKPLAKRRLADYLRDFERLAPAEEAGLTFEQVAARWLDTTKHTVKDATHDRRERCVRAVAPFVSGIPIRNVTVRHCEAWLTERGNLKAPQTFAHELNTMRAVFKYAMENGWILRNPTAGIKRRRIVSKKPNVPTDEHFQSVMKHIRADPRERGGADLVEILAYSGMRLKEATALRWQDVNFAAGWFTVTGGERGTKNHEQRTLPLSAEMLALLKRIKRAQGKATPDAFVIQVASAKKCLETACRKLELPHLHHHSLRHYFTTKAMETGIPVSTVAQWLGHKDGGALLLKRYAHLQQAHSMEQMKRMTFSVAKQGKATRRKSKSL